MEGSRIHWTGRPHVVEQYVWSIGGCLDLKTRRSFSFARIQLREVRILGLGDRQHDAVKRNTLGG
jgi:hypothetical protein